MTHFWNIPFYYLVIGYLCFIGEVLFHTNNQGQTTWVAWILFLFLCLLLIFSHRKKISTYIKQSVDKRMLPNIWIWGLLVCTIPVFYFVIREAFHPPHFFDREADVFISHMTLPRQHLLTNTLSWLSWSIGDLRPQPLQWGMAPYWFSTEYPNKVPQFLFLLFSLLALVRIGYALKERFQFPSMWAWIPAVAFIASHGVLIQAGTAMMDIPQAACLILSVVQFRRKKYVWAGVYLGLWGGSKSFYPIFLVGLIVCMWGILKIGKFAYSRRTAFVLLASIIISMTLFWGPFAVRTLKVSGSPIFPFGACMIQTQVCKSPIGGKLISSAEKMMDAGKNNYGVGRGPIAFLKSLWLISVPEVGSTMGKYDYALGLPWLIWALCFLIIMWRIIKARDLSSLPLEFFVACILWAGWWAASHQARWLYTVLALGGCGIVPLLAKKVQFQVISAVLCLGLLFGAISLRNSQKRCEGKSFSTLGKEMTEWLDKQKPTEGKPWRTLFLLYARTPVVRVIDKNKIWTTETN